MTAVTIRGTFKKDSRPSNGLETIAGELIADKGGQHYVVGVVKWAGGNLNEEGELVPAAKFLAIEPLTGGAVEDAKRILDEARKARGLGRAEDEFVRPADPTLFDFDQDGEPDEPEGGSGGNVEGGSGGNEVAETRIGPDGPHEVPPPSAAEVLAERAEAKAAKSAKPGAKSAKPAVDPFTPGDAA